jgi:hypothetical protein
MAFMLMRSRSSDHFIWRKIPMRTVRFSRLTERRGFERKEKKFVNAPYTGPKSIFRSLIPMRRRIGRVNSRSDGALDDRPFNVAGPTGVISRWKSPPSGRPFV